MKDLKNWISQKVRDFFFSRGYAIGKSPTLAFDQLRVFDLAVVALMRAKGQNLKFVQVGANDGIYGDSISRYALKYPWQGLLVEPQPDVFERLKNNYANAPGQMLFENVAIGASERRELVLYRSKAGQAAKDSYPSSVVSFRKDAVAGQLNLGAMQLEEFKVPCMPLDDLLKKHQWTQIDLLLIDTEGLDYEVLKSISLKTYTPLIVQFEHGHLSPSDINSAVQYLAKHGYQILYGSRYLDTLALHSSIWPFLDIPAP